MAEARSDLDPEPPPRQPLRLVRSDAGSWWRVHPFDRRTGQYAPDAFNGSGLGNARFSPLIDPASGRVIPTLYAASAPRGAIAETVLHNVPMPSTGYLHDLEADLRSTLHLSRLHLPALDLVNLTATGLRAAGLEPHDLFAAEQIDYPRTRRWSLWIWQHLPAAQGLLWMSRRDNRHQVMMLFGDRIAPGQIIDARDTRPIAACEALIIELLDELGAGLVPRL